MSRRLPPPTRPIATKPATRGDVFADGALHARDDDDDDARSEEGTTTHAADSDDSDGEVPQNTRTRVEEETTMDKATWKAARAVKRARQSTEDGQRTAKRKRQPTDSANPSAQPTPTPTTSQPSSASSTPATTFAALGLHPWLIAQLASVRIAAPSDIQSRAIPPTLAGSDIIASARTGSGKTAAFALPVLQKLAEDPYGVFAVVVTPTRELAFQIAEQFRILGAPINLRQTVLVGGVDMTTQSLALTRRPHVVVATPGRLVDHLESTGGAREVLGKVKFLILDEADRLLDPTFASHLDAILSALPPPGTRQTLLYSATMTPEIQVVAEGGGEGKRRPVVVNCTGRYDTVSRLDQRYILLPSTVRETYTAHLLLHPLSDRLAVVFCNRSRTAERLRIVLRELGVPSVAIHAHMAQRDRTASLARFKTGLVKVLVATDVASRGLDIPEVQAVINFDIPADATDYVHRVGRTARAGKGGVAVSLVTEHDVNLVVAIEAKIGENLSRTTWSRTTCSRFSTKWPLPNE
ncbi:DEAD-domain-containing protein [Gonapodya prolifera JEL478]|uniref:DEAD-domain-containing protein n=1 Tax=Gonapodya prolifera (strain JEL478) TaxID=1344416 RepID=A0A139A5J1_GONPJ|nr:DEAD-domain-containing protein [Gonapodya prolifera JEL478]|eukprot:KXS12060.1 DEAD-domain-containing protein [Gonapodya prolifera JEL478]